MELKTGETYRGMLVEAEDNWNSQLKDITVTGRVCPKNCAVRKNEQIMVRPRLTHRFEYRTDGFMSWKMYSSGAARSGAILMMS